jgi:hypothetical protein
MPIKKINSNIFNKSNDELILEFLKSVGKAVPPVAITLGTGLHPSRISQRLRKLTMYGKLKKIYRKLPLYSLKGDNNDS